MKGSHFYYLNIFAWSVLSTVIACSPTKFNEAVSPDSVCDATTTTCIVENGITKITQNFKVGAGKVDILFINDNSASMSPIQKKMAAKFGGFIENLDLKEIDYKIAMTTTDITSISQNSFITFGNNSKYLTKNDSGRVGLFNSAIVRQETIKCENLIINSFLNYGLNFQSSDPNYQRNYQSVCPSSDERGTYAANYIISQQNDFIRNDAHLNIILISNEDVRSGTLALSTEDKYQTLIQTISSKYPNKYWEFNSIITKDYACVNNQEQMFVTPQGHQVKNAQGKSAISASIGLQYAALSASASKDVDGYAQPRGQILNICENDYSQYFQLLATKITDSSRLMGLKCVPLEPPVVTLNADPNARVPHQWVTGSNNILFQKGSEGRAITVNYKCRVGGVQ